MFKARTYSTMEGFESIFNCCLDIYAGYKSHASITGVNITSAYIMMLLMVLIIGNGDNGLSVL